jgi:hypothetical protein
VTTRPDGPNLQARQLAFVLRARKLAADARTVGLQLAPAATEATLADYRYAMADVTCNGTDVNRLIVSGGQARLGFAAPRYDRFRLPRVAGWRVVSRAARLRAQEGY